MQSARGEFPKILFVNDYAPDSLMVADLTRQLLLGFPSQQIAWWYWRSVRSQVLSELSVGSVHHWCLPEKLHPQRKWNALRNWIMERVCVPLAARHLRRTVAAVKPDLVWVLLYGWPILVAKRANLLAGTRLHVSLWDFPDTLIGKPLLGPARSQRFVDAIFQLVRRAHSCDGICRGMLEEIASQTGRKDTILVHSGFEARHLVALEAAAPTAAQDAVRLAYVGSIISESSFQSVLAALEKVRATLSQPLVLEFFGARGYRNRPWFNAQWMVEHGIFSDEELVHSLQRCSWGIVAMDLAGEDLRYSRFSFPNKIGTYLSAGVPVLGVGHPASSLAEVMQRYRLGMFTSATSLDALAKFLREAVAVAQPRLLFRQDILHCAHTEFDAQAMRQRLWQAWGVKQ